MSNNRKFHGECHKMHTAHSKRCTCSAEMACDLSTDNPTLFVDHMTRHNDLFGNYLSASNPHKTPKWVADAGKPWKLRLPKAPKPFEPKPFEPGDQVQWIADHGGYFVMTGQVWSGHYAPKTRWVVADSNAYAVHERELVDTWLSVAQARADRGLRSNQSHDRADGKYWSEAIRTVWEQLAQLRGISA